MRANAMLYTRHFNGHFLRKLGLAIPPQSAV